MKSSIYVYKNKQLLITSILLFVMCFIISMCVFFAPSKNNDKPLNNHENVVALLPKMINETEDEEKSDNWVTCGSCPTNIVFNKKVDYSADEDWSFKFHVKITAIGESAQDEPIVEEDFDLDSINNEKSFGLYTYGLLQLEITEDLDSDYDVAFSGLANGKQEGNKYTGTFNVRSGSLIISIDNKYIKERDLVIKKTVEGTLNNPNDEFTFNIKLKNNDSEALAESYNYLINGTDEQTLSLKEESGYMVGTIKMKANDVITLKKIPLNTTYVISEEDKKDYEEVTKEVTGEISNNANNEVNFINKIVEDKEEVVEPENNEDKEEVHNPNTNAFISYIVLAIVLIFALTLFIFYKKYHDLTK